MPWKKKKHPEAEALFQSPPTLADQARHDREADAQATLEKTVKLKTLRLAKETADRAAASNKSLPASKLKASNDT